MTERFSHVSCTYRYSYQCSLCDAHGDGLHLLIMLSIKLNHRESRPAGGLAKGISESSPAATAAAAAAVAAAGCTYLAFHSHDAHAGGSR